VANPNDFRDPDYLSVPALSTGIPTTNACRVVSVTERQDDLRTKAEGQATKAARPNFISDRSGREMDWESLGGYPLLFAFGHLIELTFSEGEEREEPEDLGTIRGLDEKSEDIRTHHPAYHLESEKLHSSITIRRSPQDTSVEEAPTKGVQRGVEALEEASDETDSLIVDAFLSGGNGAVGIRHAASEKEEIFRTTFFHKHPFSEAESEVLNWIQFSLEREVSDREREGEEYSSLQGPISEFAKAIEQSDSDFTTTGQYEDLSDRARKFASLF